LRLQRRARNNRRTTSGGTLDVQANTLLLGLDLELRDNDVISNEAAILLTALADGPEQRGSLRGGLLIDIMAIKGETALKTERVAGTKTTWLDVGISQESPSDINTLVLGDRDLEEKKISKCHVRPGVERSNLKTVLTRVTGTLNPASNIVNKDFGTLEKLQVGEVGEARGNKFLKALLGKRTLNGKKGVV
jgi:hypothetical protein